MPKMALPCDTSDISVALHVITDVAATLSADLDLTAIASKPKGPPQKTTLWNDTVASVAAVLIDEKGITHTIPVPISGSPLVLTRPFRTVVDAGSGDYNVAFEWFDPCGSTEWNRDATETV